MMDTSENLEAGTNQTQKRTREEKRVTVRKEGRWRWKAERDNRPEMTAAMLCGCFGDSGESLFSFDLFLLFLRYCCCFILVYMRSIDGKWLWWVVVMMFLLLWIFTC
jgi:hypothetical protein